MLEHVGNEPDLIQRHQTEQHLIGVKTASDVRKSPEEGSRLRRVDEKCSPNFAGPFKILEIIRSHPRPNQSFLNSLELSITVFALIGHADRPHFRGSRTILGFHFGLLVFGRLPMIHQHLKINALISNRLVTIDLHEWGALFDLCCIVVD